MIIAIDGPSGSGKTTVAAEVSKRLGFRTLDTGAMYRAVTWRGLQMGFELESMKDLAEDLRVRDELIRVSQEEEISFDFDDFGVPVKVYIGGADVSQQIRTPKVDRTVSVVSACPEIRTALVAQQRKMAQGADTLLEGRDIGTVVFPNAELKVFLTASAEKRAQRRAAQNIERGIEGSSEQEILEAIKFRDSFDSSRESAPLAKADDAVEIDTSNMSLEEVVEQIVDLALSRKGSK